MPRQPAAVIAAMMHHNSARMARRAPAFGSAIASCETADGSLCPGDATAAVPLLGLMVFILTPGGPAVSAAPPDWMLHSTLSGGGMSSPSSITVATSGNSWVSSYLSAVSEFSPAGISGNGINQSFGMALDTKGNVWISNQRATLSSGLGDITELNASAQAIAAAIASGGIDYPVAVTADSNGNMWIVNYGSSRVTLFI